MSVLGKLRDKFREHAIGVTTAVLTGTMALTGAVTPDIAHAQSSYTTQEDLQNLVITIDNLKQKYSNVSGPQAAQINQLYETMQEFYVANPRSGNPQGFISAMGIFATELAQEYGLQNTPAYQNLMGTIGVYSLYEETFFNRTGEDMADRNHADFIGMKFQAMVDLQFYGAKFIEQVLPRFEAQATHDADTYRNFAVACGMVTSFQNQMQDLHGTILPANGIRNGQANAMTVEDFRNDRFGEAYTCPTPPPGIN